jgi:hypothetical protein
MCTTYVSVAYPVLEVKDCSSPELVQLQKDAAISHGEWYDDCWVFS